MSNKQKQIQQDTTVLRTATATALVTALLVAGGMYGWHLQVVQNEIDKQTAASDLNALQETVTELQERLASVANEGQLATSTYQAVLETLPLGLRCVYVNATSLTETSYQLQRPLLQASDVQLTQFETALETFSLPAASRLRYVCTNGEAYGFTAYQSNEDTSYAGIWTPVMNGLVTTPTDGEYTPAGFIHTTNGDSSFLLQTPTGETQALSAVTGRLQPLE